MSWPWARCSALVLATIAALLRTCDADAIDVRIRLYRDSNCFERVDELTLIDGGCYANIYSNITKAYSFQITGFDSPQSFLVNEYSDACNTPYVSKMRTVKSGQCIPFVGEGGLYAYVNTQLRSPICTAQCSTIKVAVQTFYNQAACQGLAYQILYYPLQGECLRWSNGTRAFRVDSSNRNITQVDYVSDDDCGGAVFQRSYSIVNGMCYPLYPNRAPMSFSWVVDIATPSTSGASFRRPRWLAGVLSLAFLNVVVCLSI